MKQNECFRLILWRFKRKYTLTVQERWMDGWMDGWVSGWMGKWISGWMYKCCSCGSVAQSCTTLCDPMDGSAPGLSVPHHLLKFAQFHVRCIGEAIQPSHPLMPSSPSALNLSQHQGLFQWVQLFASDDQNTGVSALALVLPMSIQGWFPLRLMVLISLNEWMDRWINKWVMHECVCVCVYVVGR